MGMNIISNLSDLLTAEMSISFPNDMWQAVFGYIVPVIFLFLDLS